MPRKNQVFTSFKRQKLLRKHIPSGEVLAGISCLLALLVAGVWVAAQRDAYDPSERDISMETLLADSVRDDLYKTPLERWRDPALGPVVGAAAVDLGPFPPALLEGGWTAGSRVHTYTQENLYEKINGQAEQYVKFGFKELNVVVLEHPDEDAAIDVFLYEQASFADSLGLFQEQRGSKKVEVSGKAVYTPTRVGAYGMAGRLFFHVIGSEESERVTSHTKQIVDALGTLADGGYAPEPFTILREGLGLPFEGIAYSPKNVFQLGFAKRFWFGREDPEGKPRFFLHQAESAEAADALFEKLHAEQTEEYEVLASSKRASLYRHKFLKTYFVLRCAGVLIYGVERYPEQAGAEAATERLGSALFPAEAEEGEY